MCFLHVFPAGLLCFIINDIFDRFHPPPHPIKIWNVIILSINIYIADVSNPIVEGYVQTYHSSFISWLKEKDISLYTHTLFKAVFRISLNLPQSELCGDIIIQKLYTYRHKLRVFQRPVQGFVQEGCGCRGRCNRHSCKGTVIAPLENKSLDVKWGICFYLGGGALIGSYHKVVLMITFVFFCVDSRLVLQIHSLVILQSTAYAVVCVNIKRLCQNMLSIQCENTTTILRIILSCMVHHQSCRVIVSSCCHNTCLVFIESSTWCA